jgi:hypothetical protein
MLSAIEAGAANPTLGLIVDILDALSVDLGFVANGPVFLANIQRDAAHAICSAYVQRRLQRLGFLVEREVMIRSGRSIGWIDLLAYHPVTHRLLVIEIKTRIDDVGLIERTMGWYRREARGIARQFGWEPVSVTSWLLGLASAEVDAAVDRNASILEQVFPARARGMSSALDAIGPREDSEIQRLTENEGGNGKHWPNGLALIDPSSRRSRWLIGTRRDGRRSPLPYAGYADFAQRRVRP